MILYSRKGSLKRLKLPTASIASLEQKRRCSHGFYGGILWQDVRFQLLGRFSTNLAWQAQLFPGPGELKVHFQIYLFLETGRWLVSKPKLKSSYGHLKLKTMI